MKKRPVQRNIVKANIDKNVYHFYFHLISGSWRSFILSFFSLFLSIHLFFAFLYILDQDSITGAGDTLSLWEAFCFSVQSLSTIGYGVLSPNNWYGNALVTIEAFLGILYTAILTGCFFAKISRPKDQIIFSKNLLLSSDSHTDPSAKILTLRLVSALDGELIDVNADVFMRVKDPKRNVWQLVPLQLMRSHSPTLSMNWVLFHVVDSNSPLFGVSPEDMEERDIRFIVSLNAFDRIYQQPINEQYTYYTKDLVIDHEFEDMIETHGEQITIDVEKIHNIKRQS